MKKENIIEEKSFNFSLKIIELYKLLINEKKYILSKQLLRAGTSIGANVNESISAVSRRDFINKLSISLNEARETKYWLRLHEESDLTKINVNAVLIDVEEIIRILTSIIKSSNKIYNFFSLILNSLFLIFNFYFLILNYHFLISNF
ncbi:MAG: four helix bundle protein [Melioribacteraceae bacterium]